MSSATGNTKDNKDNDLIVKLRNMQGREIDLYGMYDNLTITEHIESQGIAGYISISDSVSLLQNFPVIGEETLIVTYSSDSGDELYTREYNVYAITDKSNPQPDTFVYNLRFCSNEIFENRNIKISRSFANLEPSAVVQEMLRGSIGTTKDLFIEKSAVASMNKFIAPNISPFAVIGAMRNRSYSIISGIGGVYFFYENIDGYHYKTLDNIIESVREVPVYVIGDSNYSSPDLNYFGVVRKYEYIEPNNTFAAKLSGALGTTVKTLDFDKKSVIVEEYDYYDDFDYVSRPTISGESDPNKRLTSNKFKEAVKHRPAVMMAGLPTDPNFERHKAIRDARLSALRNGPKLIVEVPFSSELKVGIIIEIDVPNIEGKSGEERTHPDKRLSGRYLITACKHLIESDESVTSLELSRDSNNVDVENRISEESEF